MRRKHRSPRERRLRSDFAALVKLDKESSIFSFRCSGDPPDAYTVVFRGPGTCLDERTACVQTRDVHEVEIRLGADYPRLKPSLLWKTPLFHPNISTQGAVCMGGYTSHWSPSIRLADLCRMLWDMLRYANFDVGDPYNREAADWARDQDRFRFPLSDAPLRDRVAGSGSPAAPGGTGPPPRKREGDGRPGIVFLDP